MDEVLGEDVPEEVALNWDSFGFHIPDDLPKEVRTIYELGAAGKCMTCGRKVGTNARIVVNGLGITELYCGPVCQTDMAVKGWLYQEIDDLTTKIEFRGSHGQG